MAKINVNLVFVFLLLRTSKGLFTQSESEKDQRISGQTSLEISAFTFARCERASSIFFRGQID